MEIYIFSNFFIEHVNLNDPELRVPTDTIY